MNLGIIKRNSKALAVSTVNSGIRTSNRRRVCPVGRIQGPLTSTELGAALAEAGISMKPSYCFTADPDDGVDQYFRIGFGEEKVPAAIEALARFVAAKRDEWGFPRA